MHLEVEYLTNFGIGSLSLTVIFTLKFVCYFFIIIILVHLSFQYWKQMNSLITGVISKLVGIIKLNEIHIIHY